MRDPDNPFPSGFLALVAIAFIGMFGLAILTFLPDQLDLVQEFLRRHLGR